MPKLLLISTLLILITITALWFNIRSPKHKETSQAKQVIATTSTTTDQSSSFVKAPDGYATALSLNAVAGIVATGTLVDIYIYGPNDGNSRTIGLDQASSSISGPGNLVFSKMNVVVTNGKWDIDFPIPLPGANTKGLDYYQINIGHPYTGASSSLTLNKDRTSYNLLKIR